VAFNTTVKKYATKVLFWQLVLIMGLALVFFLVSGLQAGVSTLAGGLTYWLSTFLFVWRLATQTRIPAPIRFIAEFFGGEALKLLLTAVLFVLVITQGHASLFYSLFGLIVAVIGFWLASVGCLYRTENQV
jgi:ATP synthase protein I